VWDIISYLVLDIVGNFFYVKPFGIFFNLKRKGTRVVDDISC